MSINKELLLKVKKHILQKPSRLRMSSWVMYDTGVLSAITKIKGKRYFTNLDTGWSEPEKQRVPECGTIGCIAGWTCLINNKEKGKNEHVSSTQAIALLNLPSSSLFYITSWPAEYYNKYIKAKNQRERARIVGQVIDLAIKYEGYLTEDNYNIYVKPYIKQEKVEV